MKGQWFCLDHDTRDLSAKFVPFVWEQTTLSKGIFLTNPFPFSRIFLRHTDQDAFPVSSTGTNNPLPDDAVAVDVDVTVNDHNDVDRDAPRGVINDE